MSDEFGNWNDLAKLWLTQREPVSSADIEGYARRQHLHMLALAWAEAGALALAFVAAVWIAVHTDFVAMSAISIVFFGVCGYLQHRMRREPPPAGSEDLMTSLAVSIEREEWVLAQLGVGRAVTLLTLVALTLLDSDHVRYLESTPAERLWALFAITSVVLAVLAWNLWLAGCSKRKRAQLTDFARRLRGDSDTNPGAHR